MFWGISLEVGKRYSQTVEKSFHISMAALNASAGGTAKGSVTIMVEVEKACYPLCTLHPEKIPQQALDYVFTEGEEVLFYTEGDLEVHLTGYLLDDPNPMEYSSDEEEESTANSEASSCDEANKGSSDEDNLESLISELDGLNEDNERSMDVLLPQSARKKQKSEDMMEEMTVQANLTGKLLDNGSESEEDEEDDDDDDWQPGRKRKLSKKKSKVQAEEKVARSDKKIDNSSNHEDSKNNKTESNNSPSKQSFGLSKNKKKSLKNKDVNNSNGFQEDTVADSEHVSVDKNCSQDEKSHNEESKNKMDVQNNEGKTHDRKDLPGGTIIEDITRGQGKKAKKGKQVSFYYKGSLKKSKKHFDSCLEPGKPFTFKLGAGDVIKGWDIGIEGMQVGGKRRITIPPSQGYGSKPAMGSRIPANSTLVFVVELIKVN